MVWLPTMLNTNVAGSRRKKNSVGSRASVRPIANRAVSMRRGLSSFSVREISRRNAGVTAITYTRHATASPSRNPLAAHFQRDRVDSTVYAAKSRSVGSAKVLTRGYQPNARLVNVRSTAARRPHARAPARRAAWR